MRTDIGLEQVTELAVKDFTPGVLGVTNLPITQGEDGEHYGLGHLDKDEFALAASKIDNALGAGLRQDEFWAAEDVDYKWAVITSYEEDGTWSVRWVEEGTANSFPMTVITGP